MSKSSSAVIKWRKRTKQKIVESMGGCCQVCGYFKCEAALELHHIDSSKKDFSFGSVRANPQSADLIKTELKKCILLCSNCHKEIHDGVTSMPESYAKLNEEIFDSWKIERKERKEKFKKDRIWRQKMFLTNEEVNEKLSTIYNGNKSAMARDYGVTETTIRKRIKKYYSGVVK
jgi:hypothetical protein